MSDDKPLTPDQLQALIAALRGPNPTGGTIAPESPEASAMTHKPEQPNPAAPYLDAASRFARGGIHGALQNTPYALPPWSDTIARALNSPSANDAMSFGMPELGALKLSPYYRVLDTHGFHLVDEGGQKVGSLVANWVPHKRDIYISDIQSSLPTKYPAGATPLEGNELAGSLGHADIRSIVEALKDQFPRAETVSGLRVRGARAGPAGTGGAEVKVRIRPPVK